MANVLHVALYPHLYPPKNGGMLRCWNISKQLSKYFDVDLFCLQSNLVKTLETYPDELDQHRLNFIVPEKNFDVNKNTGIKKIKTALKYRWEYKTFSSASSKAMEMSSMWDKIRDKDYDIIFLEHLEALSIRNRLKKLFPKAKIIFDAHNVDHLLLKNEVSIKKIETIKKQESELFETCDLIFACSELDAKLLRELNDNKIKVLELPNGVDCHYNFYQLPDFTRQNKRIIFCGALETSANSNGIIWFIKEIWPRVINEVPDVKLTIVGRGGRGPELKSVIMKSCNIDFVGEVDDVRTYYRDAVISIVPLLHGSGTRLKISEAMSLGMPVVSTGIGAEGIDYTDNENILIANSVELFSSGIVRLLNDPNLSKTLSTNGKKLVEMKYCWEKIGEKLALDINTQMNF